MMVFRILGQTISSMYSCKFYGVLETGKNCFYRLLVRCEMDWRILHLSMAKRFQSIVRKEKAERGCPEMLYCGRHYFGEDRIRI